MFRRPAPNRRSYPVSWRACGLRLWLSIVAALVVMGILFPSRVTSADSPLLYEQYRQYNLLLDQLLVQREQLLATLAAAAGAEQAALGRLTTAETRLHGLLRQLEEISRRQPQTAATIAAAETRLVELDQERARLERRVAATERWLFGDAPLPAVYGRHPYQVARQTLDVTLAEETARVEASLLAARDAQARDADLLGQTGTDITTWQAEAERQAMQVGAARSRALAASSQLAAMQREGEEIAAVAAAQFQALRAAGHPVGIAQIAGGLVPIAEPVTWPSSTPGYALPAGRTAGSLVAGPPLFISAERFAATGLVRPGEPWMAPVNGPITTPFGDATPYQAAHYAIDIATRLYAPVVAAADGAVEFAGLANDNRLASYGAAVLLRHDAHLTTLYSHLDDRAYGLAVSAGEPVKRGQVIGYVGLTGYTTGPHLHFEVRLDNQPIDPLLLVRP